MMKQINAMDAATIRRKYDISASSNHRLVDTSIYVDGPGGFSKLMSDAEEHGCEDVVFVVDTYRHNGRAYADMLVAAEKETGRKALIIYVTSPDATNTEVAV